MDTITKRIDKITTLTPDRLSEIPTAPRSVKIELTARCNYLCGFCALTVRGTPAKGDMDWGLFQRITREMREAGVEEIGVFYIGESFMAPKLLVDAIRYLKTELQMPYVFLTSNASMATPDVVEACMQAGLNSLKWSVNASDEEQFKEVMAVSPRMFYKARANIQAAWKVRETGGYKTRLYASSIRYDGEQHEKMQAMLKTEVIPYVDEHYWLPLYSMGSLTIPREEQLGYTPGVGNIGRADNPVAPLPCWLVFNEGHVLADGRLSACGFDATGHWIMGDLTRQSFMEAWHSADFQALRRAHIAKDVRGTKCEHCIAYQGTPTAVEPQLLEIGTRV